MKVKVTDDHCKGCIWMNSDKLCPFQRCVKQYGWTIESWAEVDKDEQKAD